MANEVAVECKGLPLDIVIVGSVLREKDADEWTIVSQKLKDSKSVDIEDVDVNLYACPKLNYDYLKARMLTYVSCSVPYFWKIVKLIWRIYLEYWGC